MEILETVFEVLDMRSFSNLWYWIGLAVVWSSTSHWVLGIPHDMIQRARREGGQPMEDVEDLARINVGRLLHVMDQGALAIVGLGCFWLTVLGILAFFYDVEFAQALFLVMLPMAAVVWLSVRARTRQRPTAVSPLASACPCWVCQLPSRTTQTSKGRRLRSVAPVTSPRPRPTPGS